MTITQVTILCTLIHFGGFIIQAQENVVYISLYKFVLNTRVNQLYNCVLLPEEEGVKNLNSPDSTHLITFWTKLSCSGHCGFGHV